MTSTLKISLKHFLNCVMKYVRAAGDLNSSDHALSWLRELVRNPSIVSSNFTSQMFLFVERCTAAISLISRSANRLLRTRGINGHFKFAYYRTTYVNFGEVWFSIKRRMFDSVKTTVWLIQFSGASSTTTQVSESFLCRSFALDTAEVEVEVGNWSWLCDGRTESDLPYMTGDWVWVIALYQRLRSTRDENAWKSFICHFQSKQTSKIGSYQTQQMATKRYLKTVLTLFVNN